MHHCCTVLEGHCKLFLQPHSSNDWWLKIKTNSSCVQQSDTLSSDSGSDTGYRSQFTVLWCNMSRLSVCSHVSVPSVCSRPQLKLLFTSCIKTGVGLSLLVISALWPPVRRFNNHRKPSKPTESMCHCIINTEAQKRPKTDKWSKFLLLWGPPDFLLKGNRSRVCRI